MLKLFLKLAIIVLILFGIGQYSSYLITGKTPDISINKPRLPNINSSELKNSLSNKFNTINGEKPVVETYLYKWRDAKGVMHYASEKPSGNIQNLETIVIRSDTNVVPAVQESGAANRETTQQQALQSASTELSTNVYSAEGIKHLFDQAKGKSIGHTADINAYGMMLVGATKFNPGEETRISLDVPNGKHKKTRISLAAQCRSGLNRT